MRPSTRSRAILPDWYNGFYRNPAEMSDPFELRPLPKARADSAVKVFDIVDPTAAAEDFDALDQEVVHLGAGRFHARRVRSDAAAL